MVSFACFQERQTLFRCPRAANRITIRLYVQISGDSKIHIAVKLPV